MNLYELIWYVVKSQDKQWEDVDEEWVSCLRNEKPENILLIPSGSVQVKFFFFCLG